MSWISPCVAYHGPVCEFADWCSFVDCVDVTTDHLDVGHLRLGQVCPELLELVFADELLHRRFESHTDICVVVAVLVVFAPFTSVSWWICSREPLGRGRWYLILTLIENLLKGCG